MAKQKLEDILAKGLISMGYREIPSKNRYRMFKKEGETYKLIGKAGALRRSDKGTAADSHSVHDGYRDMVLRKGRGEE